MLCLHQRFSLEETRFLHFKGILAQDQGFTTYSQQKQNTAIIDDLQDKKNIVPPRAGMGTQPGLKTEEKFELNMINIGYYPGFYFSKACKLFGRLTRARNNVGCTRLK